MTQTATSAPARLGRDYWRLWWANTISSTGDGAFVAALPLLAVTITRDPRLVSVVTAATYLPWLLLSLPAGAVVDRCDRATLMWRAQAVQAGRGRGGHHPRRLPPGGHRGARRGRPAAGQRRGHLQQRRPVGAARAGAARTAAQGQRQPAGQPDRRRVVPRPAGRQPAVRRGRGAAVRARRRVVRRLGRAAGRACPGPARAPAGHDSNRRQDPRPDRRRAALAGPAPPAPRGRRAARRLQLRQPDGPGHPGPAGHPDAAREHPRLRAAAGGHAPSAAWSADWSTRC